MPDIGARESLKSEFETALRSVLSARDFAREEVSVEVVVAHFSDENHAIPGVKLSGSLKKSALDFVPGGVPRRLPLQREVLEAFGSPAKFDWCVLTNSDIHVRPDFYLVIAETVRAGIESFSVTRRTVEPPFRASTAHRIAGAKVGKPHPGNDCFVFPSNVLPALDVGRVTMGVSIVNRPLMINLALRCPNFQVLRGFSITYHLGDDRPWQGTEFEANDSFNWVETLGVISRLKKEFGVVAVENVIRNVGIHLPSQLSKEAKKEIPADFQRTHSLRCRFVFVATNARSGTQWFAQAFSDVTGLYAEHEGSPKMIGDVLRGVLNLGMEETFAERQSKAAELLRRLYSAGRGQLLLDSNHMFLKTYADVVFDLLNPSEIAVVELFRNPVDVVKSYFELAYFTEQNSTWSDWLVDARSPKSFFPLDVDFPMDEVDLAIASLVETNERKHFFKSRTGVDVTWVPWRLEAFRSIRQWKRLLKILEVSNYTLFAKSLLFRANRRLERKAEFDRSISTQEVRDRLIIFANRFHYRPEVQRFFRDHAGYFPVTQFRFPASCRLPENQQPPIRLLVWKIVGKLIRYHHRRRPANYEPTESGVSIE